jgi:hypothetical protein
VAAPSSFGHISIAESVGRASLSSEVSCAADDALDMGLLLQETDEWVSAVERAAPVNWQDCFLDVSRLAGLALACSPQKGSSAEWVARPCLFTMHELPHHHSLFRTFSVFCNVLDVSLGRFPRALLFQLC